VPFADTSSTEPLPESLQCQLEYIWLKKVMRPKIEISLVKYCSLAPIMIAFRKRS